MMQHFTKASLMSSAKDFRRDFINSLTGYKSLNLIGTQSTGGKTNVAPFSQVFHIGASPPVIGILFRPHTVERNTLENILETGYFTLNQVTAEFYKEAHHCSARWEKSEFEATGLEEEFLESFYAPYVKKSPLKSGCKLIESITLSVNDTVLIIGELEHVYVQEDAVGPTGFISLPKLGTVTVSGLDEYHIGKKLARLAYAKPDQSVREIE